MSRFGIVVFSDDSTEIISEKWILPCHKKCYYPKGFSTKKLHKLVKRHEDIDEKFNVYDCRVLKWFDSFDEALEKIPLSLCQSDLSSCETPQRKTVLTPRRLPPPPSKTINQAGIDELANPFFSPTNEEHNINNDYMPSLVLVKSEIEPSEPTPNPLDSSKADSEFKKDVLLRLEQIQQNQGIQMEIMTEILQRIQALTIQKRPTVAYQFPKELFPLKSTHELDTLNITLGEDDSAYRKLVSIIARCGGTTIFDALKLSSKELFQDELLAMYCFKGSSKTEKLALIKFNFLLKAIIDGLNENVVLGTVTKDDVEKFLPKVIKLATDRVFQRQAAAKRKDDSAEHQT